MDKLKNMGKQFNVSLKEKQFAVEADKQDPLAPFRQEFFIPPPSTVVETSLEHVTKKLKPSESKLESIYLCGNSLGLQPKSTQKYLEQELIKWRLYGVEGHFRSDLPWVTVDEICVKQMAEIVGAKAIEVALMNSLTVNLHLMMVAFYRPTAVKHKIVIEAKAFPSDHHAVKSQIRFHGFDADKALIALSPREGESALRTADILQCIQDEAESIALVMLSGIQYYTGEFFDLEAITKTAHENNCLVGFDLAHAVGNVPLELHKWGVDFAVWCTYKYLNSGPGSIGGCFVHECHANDRSLPRFAGWWGHRKSDRFDMSPDFIPSPGAFGFQLSNPPVLCLAALKSSLDLFERATMPRLREKSELLTAYLEFLLNEELGDRVRCLTPQDPSRRGCQLSLVFDQELEKVHETITAQGVICDLRKPNVMRIAPCPLYNSYQDVFLFIQTLEKALTS